MGGGGKVDNFMGYPYCTETEGLVSEGCGCKQKPFKKPARRVKIASFIRGYGDLLTNVNLKNTSIIGFYSLK